MKGDGIPLTPPSVLYYRVRTYLPGYQCFVKAVTRSADGDKILAGRVPDTRNRQ